MDNYFTIFGEDLPKYFPVKSKYSIDIDYNGGLYITFKFPLGDDQSILKDKPYLKPYFNGTSIKLHVKGVVKTQLIIDYLRNSEGEIAVLDIIYKDDALMYNSLMLYAGNITRFNNICGHGRIAKNGSCYIINKDNLDMNDYLNTISDCTKNLWLSGFLANLYTDKQNTINKLYVQNDMRYNILIDTVYWLCDATGKKLYQFSNLISAVKYLMFVTFSDKESYNKYIELYPNFLKGKDNEQH